MLPTTQPKLKLTFNKGSTENNTTTNGEDSGAASDNE